MDVFVVFITTPCTIPKNMIYQFYIFLCNIPLHSMIQASSAENPFNEIQSIAFRRLFIYNSLYKVHIL